MMVEEAEAEEEEEEKVEVELEAIGTGTLVAGLTMAGSVDRSVVLTVGDETMVEEAVAAVATSTSGIEMAVVEWVDRMGTINET